MALINRNNIIKPPKSDVRASNGRNKLNIFLYINAVKFTYYLVIFNIIMVIVGFIGYFLLPLPNVYVYNQNGYINILDVPYEVPNEAFARAQEIEKYNSSFDAKNGLAAKPAVVIPTPVPVQTPTVTSPAPTN